MVLGLVLVITLNMLRFGQFYSPENTHVKGSEQYSQNMVTIMSKTIFA